MVGKLCIVAAREVNLTVVKQMPLATHTTASLVRLLLRPAEHRRMPYNKTFIDTRLRLDSARPLVVVA